MIYQLGDRVPKIDPTAWVAESASIIGNVELAEDVSVWYGVVLRGDGQGNGGMISIGPRTNVQDNAVMHGTTIIGSDCVIAHLALVHASRVGDGVLIGNAALVFDGVEVGDRAFIAAGSVVVPGTKVPPNTLMVGSPARPRGEVKENHRKMATGLAASYLRSVAEYKTGLKQI